MAVVGILGQTGKTVKAAEGSGSFSLTAGSGTQNITVALEFVPNMFAIYSSVGAWRVALYWYNGDLLSDFSQQGDLSGNSTIVSISLSGTTVTIAFQKSGGTVTCNYQWKAFMFE